MVGAFDGMKCLNSRMDYYLHDKCCLESVSTYASEPLNPLPEYLINSSNPGGNKPLQDLSGIFIVFWLSPIFQHNCQYSRDPFVVHSIIT